MYLLPYLRRQGQEILFLFWICHVMFVSWQNKIKNSKHSETHQSQQQFLFYMSSVLFTTSAFFICLVSYLFWINSQGLFSWSFIQLSRFRFIEFRRANNWKQNDNFYEVRNHELMVIMYPKMFACLAKTNLLSLANRISVFPDMIS